MDPYEYFAEATVLAQGQASEAAKRAVLKARQPVKSVSEKRERDREVLARMQEYRRLNTDEEDYWENCATLEAILEHTDSMPFEEAQAEYAEYASSPITRPVFYTDVERPDFSELMQGSKFNTNNENAATAASTKGI